MRLRHLLAAIAAAAAGVSLVGCSAHSRTVPDSIRGGGERDLSRDNGVESETALAADPIAPRVLVAGSNVPKGKTMAVFASTDGGAAWSAGRLPLPPSTCATSDPTVAIGRAHQQYYAFLGLHCHRGRHGGDAVYIAERRNAAGRWHLLVAPATRGGRFTILDDRPFLLVDTSAKTAHPGRLYLGWTRMGVDPNAYFVYPDEVDDYQPVEARALVSHSDDGGRHWTRPRVLAATGAPLEVRLATAADGTLYAVWRDQSTGSIWVAKSDNGTTFDRRVFVAGAAVDPKRSCGGYRARISAQPVRCVSPNPVVSVDRSTGQHSGHVYVTWGTTSLDGSQKVEVAAFDAQLKPLLGVGALQQVDSTEGAPTADQFLPASTVDDSGNLWVCYYESIGVRRRKARYGCTVSADGGRTWAKQRFLASRASDETVPRADRRNGFGDYEAVAAGRRIVYALWTDGRAVVGPRREEIFGARLRLLRGR